MGKKEHKEKDGSIKRKKYEKELRRLQAELCKLQDWVKYKGLRVIVLFEGRMLPEKAVPFVLSPNVSVPVYSVLWLFLPHRTAKNRRYTFSAIYNISRLPVKS